MSDKRRKIIVYSILAIAIVWGLWNNPLSSKDEAKQQDEQPVVLGEADMPYGSEQVVTTESEIEIPKYRNYDGWKDDPFSRKIALRKVAQVNKEIELKLSAISTQGNRSMAIINGKVLSRNGLIDGWAVAEIDAESVLLVKGSKNVKLNLKRR